MVLFFRDYTIAQYLKLPVAANEMRLKFTFESEECSNLQTNFNATNGSSDLSTESMYDEVDFDPLKIKVRWCSKNMFGNTSCGNQSILPCKSIF